MPGLFSFLPSFNFGELLSRLNPFRNINFEQDILGRFGSAFMPRGARQNQPSYYSDASENPIVGGVSSAAGSLHPVLGLAANSLGTGITAGLASSNPFVGIASGVASLAQGIIKLPGELRKREAAQREAQRQSRMDSFYNTGTDAFKSFKRFSDNYGKDKSAILEELRVSRGILENMEKRSRETQKKDPFVIEQQKVSDAVQTQRQNEDPVKAYNNLQIQRINSFTINSEPALAPRKQTARRGVADRYMRSSLGSHFFATV